MAAPTYTATNISADWDRGSIISNYVAAVPLTIGQVVYIDANNQANPAKADTSAKAKAVGIVVGAPNFYGETNIVAGNYAAVVISGPVYGYSGLASGTVYWVDKTTAGALTDTAPTGAYQFSVCRAVGADTMFVDYGITNPVSA